ncbi:hypothetical protein COCON_G00234070 [Conger conger]|uniref:Uncharacterized protein n=1 Tax=Conger conger TaxID=82655 RepID=A0A9Q1HMC7_CONCO|nr:hypothetical protein COCON_G00234070 [Conger conger]
MIHGEVNGHIFFSFDSVGQKTRLPTGRVPQDSSLDPDAPCRRGCDILHLDLDVEDEGFEEDDPKAHYPAGTSTPV